MDENFKEGDFVFLWFVGTEQVQIIKHYPKSKRYRVLQGTWERNVHEYEVFKSKQQLIESMINKIDEKINKLKIEKDKLREICTADN